MSVSRSTMIGCDGGCDEHYPIDAWNEGTATDHRADLRSEGWHVSLPGGRDICDLCWAEGKR